MDNNPIDQNDRGDYNDHTGLIRIRIKFFVQNYGNDSLADPVDPDLRELKLTAWRMLVKNIVEEYSNAHEITAKEYHGVSRMVIEELALNEQIATYTVFNKISMENLSLMKDKIGLSHFNELCRQWLMEDIPLKLFGRDFVEQLKQVDGDFIAALADL